LTRAPDLPGLEIALQGCTLAWQEPVLTVRAPQSQPVDKTNALCLRALLDLDVGILEVDAGHSLEAAYMELKRGA
jgi:hypothetical protein